MKEENEELVKIKIAKANEVFDEVVEILYQYKLWNTSVNRLYYSCFYAVSALLLSKDIYSKTHSGTKQMFGLHFIKTGLISESSGEFYTDIFTMRQKADYEDLVEYEEADVKRLIPLTSMLITEISSYLSTIK